MPVPRPPAGFTKTKSCSRFLPGSVNQRSAIAESGSSSMALSDCVRLPKPYFRSIMFVVVVTASVSLCLHPAERKSLSAKRPHFIDIAGRSKISYVTKNDFQDRKYFQQPLCGGVAVLDYDNDGWTDIFIANTGVNTLYHNNGDGTFSDVTEVSGLASKPAHTLSVQA